MNVRFYFKYYINKLFSKNEIIKSELLSILLLHLHNLKKKKCCLFKTSLFIGLSVFLFSSVYSCLDLRFICYVSPSILTFTSLTVERRQRLNMLLFIHKRLTNYQRPLRRADKQVKGSIGHFRGHVETNLL